MTTLPPEISFGYVVGRWILAVGDTEADPDEYPDAAIPTGTVVFTRIDANVSLIDTTQNDGTWVAVARKNVTATLNAQGELALPHSTNAGLWLITGAYNVTVSVANVTWPAFSIVITTDHTPENPLDLVTASPVQVTPTVTLLPSIDTMVRAEAAADRAELSEANIAAIIETEVNDWLTLNPRLPGEPGPQGPLWSAEIRSANSSDNLYNYIGKAADASLEADAVWTITRITLTDPVGVKTTATNVAWTDRETEVYS